MLPALVAPQSFHRKNDLECRMLSLQSRALSLFPAAIGSLLLALPAAGQLQVSAINSPDGKPLSQRVVAYWIDAQVDTSAKTLDATEILEYRNPSDQPVSTIPFHLYLNAFRPQSTFAKESHQEGVNLYRNKEEQGAIDIKSIALEGYGDLAQNMRFTAPSPNRWRRRKRFASTSPFTISSRSPEPEPDISEISSWGPSGSLRWVSFGTARGIVISITMTLSSSPTSALTTSTLGCLRVIS
jgi:hypothetical protein